MASGSGGGSPPQPALPLDLVAFQTLLFSYSKEAKGKPHSRFVKKLDEILKVSLHSPSSKMFTLKLAKNGLIGKFIGI